MSDAWIGKSVSINCGTTLGIFQGTIKNADPNTITISRAFRNGVPLRDPDMEVKISATDILQLELISTEDSVSNSAEWPKSEEKKKVSALTSKLNKTKLESSKNNQKSSQKLEQRGNNNGIDIPGRSNGLNQNITPFKNKQKYRHFQNDQTFGTSVDDPIMDEEFDFEKNLALFDKQALWNEINGTQQKPDILKQAVQSQSLPKSSKKYRHDENILTTAPLKLRQIELRDNSPQEYVTDTGLVIPTISESVKVSIQNAAENNGLSWGRLCDSLARSVCEMTIQLIGGARRLIPKNEHQWPNIMILCDQGISERHTDLGLATGRLLSSHGLKTIVYIKTPDLNLKIKNIELDLYAATGNIYVNSLNDLPTFDIVILSAISPELDTNLIKWINSNRSPTLAINPPVSGFNNLSLKCSILPILPLHGMNTNCGKLYLANLGIPEKFFQNAGVKYKSPFGHKSVIPIHEAD